MLKHSGYAVRTKNLSFYILEHIIAGKIKLVSMPKIFKNRQKIISFSFQFLNFMAGSQNNIVSRPRFSINGISL